MNGLKDKLESAITNLTKVEEEVYEFVNRLDQFDLIEQDILHFVENNKITTSGAYSLMRKLQDNRKERREVKQLHEIWKTYRGNNMKLNNKENREMLLAEIKKTEKCLCTKYNNRILTIEELNDMSKKGVKKGNK